MISRTDLCPISLTSASSTRLQVLGGQGMSLTAHHCTAVPCPEPDTQILNACILQRQGNSWPICASGSGHFIQKRGGISDDKMNQHCTSGGSGWTPSSHSWCPHFSKEGGCYTSSLSGPVPCAIRGFMC